MRTNDAVLIADFHEGIVEERKNTFTLAPNPARDQLSMNSTSCIDAVSILSADGREVMRLTMRSRSATVHVADLPSGAYFLIANMNNGTIARERFIIQ